jgi:response regulator RpfG family c-di-GMP phosphodiesterase
MEPKNRIAVLCVDDEPNVLEGIALNLRRRYSVTTAGSGAAGLEALEKNREIAIVLSDMRMPGMDGATFLSRARLAAPNAVRMLLTGQTELNAAIAAVNEGQIFRFLTKPCTPDDLLAAFEAAATQHRLITAERVLLEQTVRGSIKMLTDVMSLSNPTVFGRAMRIKEYGTELASAGGVDAVWSIEVAAMLSQVGCITLPPSTMEKLYHGQPLQPDEQLMADRLPALVDGLLANIPRLEDVRACIVHQTKHFDGAGLPAGGPKGEKIPVGARVLKIVSDFDVLESRGNAAPVALDIMRGRTGWYDPHLLETFATLRGNRARQREVREIPLRLVTAGMSFVEDVTTSSGALLIARGYVVTEGLLERIRNFSVKGNVRVTVPRTRDAR